MPSPETSRENGKLGGRPEGSKNQSTLDREHAREYYLEQLKSNVEKLTQVHVEQALKPENGKEREYALNQLIGKPVEKMEVEQTTTLKVDC